MVGCQSGSSCMPSIKPKRLERGDTVAIVSPSWGGPSIFPHVYESGLKCLQEDFGLKIKEYPTARMKDEELYNNPKLRAKDINDAFEDKEVKAVFASIGGEDSVRILPYLDAVTIRNNPKILMGYSDTSTLLTYCNQLGLVTFNGPSIMAGFSQMGHLPDAFKEHVRTILFDAPSSYAYQPFEMYCEGYADWTKPKLVGQIKNEHPQEPWNWLQGSGAVQGELFGGCFSVLGYFLNGTPYWPKPDFWKGKILFLETAEDKPTPETVKYMLRGFGAQGIFQRISGLVFGRPRDYSPQEKQELDRAILMVVQKEFGCSSLPIVTNMDFGHTDPQWVMPLGVRAEINCNEKMFKLVESPCV